LQPTMPLESSLIGPPLRDTMAMVAGYPSEGVVNQLLAEFKKAYDDQGCLKTPSFKGVEAMMRTLKLSGIRLFIATNKRAYPTHKIMDHLGWTDFFEGVYGPDSFDPPKPNKAALIKQILLDHALDTSLTLYVGDRNEDGQASQANLLNFLFAKWGYGQDQDVAATSSWAVAATPDEVLTLTLA
jgi:phosphoglycolate phosphatase